MFDQGADADCATPFTLVGDERLQLLYAEVSVAGRNPRVALFEARNALSRLADCLSRRWHVPLVLVRIDLYLQDDEWVLARELVMPSRTVLDVDVNARTLVQPPLFAPVDALLREAVTASSPYYRFLCAFKLREAVQAIRSEVRRIAKVHQVTARMPKSVALTPKDFTWLSGPAVIEKLKSSNELYKVLTEMRNRVGHFLLDASHEVLPLWDGRQFRQYSLASAVLLDHADSELKALATYYNTFLLEKCRASLRPRP
jgi:hypothetical protein